MTADMLGAPVAVFDGHNDTLLKLELAERRARRGAGQGEPRTGSRTGGAERFGGGDRGLDIDLPRAREAGFAGGFFAFFTPASAGRTMARPVEAARPRAAFEEDPAQFAAIEQGPALAFTLALFARLHRLARALPDDLAICRSVGEVRAAMAAGRIAAVPHLEGAEAIDTDFRALEILAAAGLVSLGPLWSRPNAFGDGAPMACQPDPEPGCGLTDAGRALIRACEELGLLVDLAHLSPRGFWDVAAMTTRPLVASHSNAHALSPNARNLTDAQLDAIAETGGLVGLNFHVAFLREDCAVDHRTPIETCLRHLDHLIERLGEGGVGLGSDFDGCELPAEIGDVTGLPRLVAAMRQAGYGEALIARICRENWLDVMERSGL